jgi:hypothetical protein
MNTNKTDSFANRNYYFASFDSKYDFEKKGKEAYEKLLSTDPRSLTIRTWENASIDADFVGSSDRSELDAGNFTDFIDRPALETSIDSFDTLFSKIDMGGAFEKSRLIITDDKRGIFDFGLASKGLYKPQEYFSEELAKDLPFEFPTFFSGIVPFDKIYIDQMNQYWYKSFDNGKTYLMTPQQEGTRAIELKIPNAKLKFKTKTKKAYVMFKKKGGKAEFVDLYIGAGGRGTLSYEGMLAKILPLLLVARYLEMAGIKTRINTMRIFEEQITENGRTIENVFCFTYPIKEFGEDLDFNWIAINNADPRWFRWNMWKYLSALSKEIHDVNSLGYGTTIYGGSLLYETFNRFKNWKIAETEKGNFQDLGIDYNLMITGGLSSPENLISNQQQEIEDEFFRILDVIDYQFNDPKKASTRIYDRLTEKGYGRDRIKNFITDALESAYSYPQRGQFATPPETQDKIEEDFDKAFEGTVDFFNTLK